MLFRQPNWSGPQLCAGSWMTAYVCLLVFVDYSVTLPGASRIASPSVCRISTDPLWPAVPAAHSGLPPGAATAFHPGIATRRGGATT